MIVVLEVVLVNEVGFCYVVIVMVIDYDCWRDDYELVSILFMCN